MKTWKRSLALLVTIAIMVVSTGMPGMAFSEESAIAADEGRDVVAKLEEVEVVESEDLSLGENDLGESRPPETTDPESTSASDTGTRANVSNGPSSIRFIESELEMRPGEEEDLMDYIEMNPEDAETTYSWKSSKKKVAKVDKDGMVTAVGSGSTKITVKTKNKKKATIKITVPQNKIKDLCEIPTRDDYDEIEGGWTLWPVSIEVNSKGRIVCEFYLLNGTGEKSKRIQDMRISLAVGTPDNIVAETSFSKINVSCKNNKYKKFKLTFPAHTVMQKDVFFPDYEDDIYFDIEETNSFGLRAGKGLYDFIPTMFPRPEPVAFSAYLSKDNLKLLPGNSQTLTVTIIPETTRIVSTTWASSNPEIASVGQDGKIEAIQKGNTTITVTIVSESGQIETRECIVTVDDEEGQHQSVPTDSVDVTSITLDQTAVSIIEGHTLTLNPTVLPEDATDKSIKWSSDNKAVATVSEDGEVRAVSAGNAIITAEAKDGSGVKATCEVTVVSEPVPGPVKVTSITLNQTTANITVGETIPLKPTILPVNATDKSIEWSSNNEAAATVADGVVKAVAKGEAIITAKAKDGSGVTATCTIVVLAPVMVTSITLDPPSATLAVGQMLTLTPNVLPTNATDKSIEWSSNNEAVATVADGAVKGVGNGEAIITAEAKDGSGVKATCAITIIPPVKVTSITLDPPSATLTVGQTLTLTPTVLPANATDKSIKWSSNNEAVATVTDGVVKAIAAGNATIIAEAKDGSGVKTECAVSIESVKVTSIALDPPSATLKVGQTLTLMPNILPTNATDKSIKWSSNNDAAATVIDGEVKAVAEGEATIIAEAKDGSGVKSECVVTVIKQPDDLGKPTNVEATASSDGSVIVTWTKTTGGDGYSISYSKEGYSAAQTIHVDGIDTQKYTIPASQLEEGVTYTIRVTATIGIDPFTSSDYQEGLASDPVNVKVANTDTLIESITLNIDRKTLEIGETVTLSATVLPDNATTKEIVWSSNTKAVATVDAGVVTARGEGLATIIASAQDGSGVAARCAITVLPYEERIGIPTNVNAVANSDGSITVSWTKTTGGDGYKVNYKLPGDSQIYTIHVDGIGTQSCTIPASSLERGVEYSITVAATIGIDLFTSADYKEGEESSAVMVTTSALPSRPANVVAETTSTGIFVTWNKISGISKFYVRINDGNDTTKYETNTNSCSIGISSLKKGTTYSITVTAVNGSGEEGPASASKTVFWNPEVMPTSIRISNAPSEAKVGDTLQLAWTVNPSTADNDRVLWESTNDSVIAVSDSGLLSAVGVGSATVKAIAEANDIEASFTVTVAQRVPLAIGVPALKIETVAPEYVGLCWNNVLTNNGEKVYFTVERSSSENGSYTTLSTGIKRWDYIDTTVSPSTTYYYRIKAYAIDSNTSARVEKTSKAKKAVTPDSRGSGGYRDTSYETGQEDPTPSIAGITVNPSVKDLAENMDTNSSNVFVANFTPAGANGSVTWRSSNNAVLNPVVQSDSSITQYTTGHVTKPTKVTLTATANGKSGMAQVTVYDRPTITVDGTALASSGFANHDLKNGNLTITWTNGQSTSYTVNTAVYTQQPDLSSDGSGNNAGRLSTNYNNYYSGGSSLTIPATSLVAGQWVKVAVCAYGTAWSVFAVKISDSNVELQSISIDGSRTRSVALNSSVELSATLIPNETTNKTVTWTAEDTSIVSVTPNGTKATIKALKAGTTRVNVKHTLSGLSDYIVVAVPEEHQTRFIVEHDALSGTTLVLEEKAEKGHYSTFSIDSNAAWSAELTNDTNNTSDFLRFVEEGSTSTIIDGYHASGAADKKLKLRMMIQTTPAAGTTSTATVKFTVDGKMLTYTIKLTKPDNDIPSPIAPWSITMDHDELAQYAVDIIAHNESRANYQSVRDIDGNAPSIGIFQWNADRALNILRRIAYKNSTKAYQILGSTLYGEVETSGISWKNKGRLTSDEVTQISELLGTEEGIAAQREQALSDATGYLRTGRNYSITDKEVLLQFADVSNLGTGFAQQVLSSARTSANSYSAITLSILNSAAHNHSVIGDSNGYKNRHNTTYNSIIALGFNIPTDNDEVVVSGSFSKKSIVLSKDSSAVSVSVKGIVDNDTIARMTVNYLRIGTYDEGIIKSWDYTSGTQKTEIITIDVSKAPFNSSGTYELHLWVKAKDGTVNDLTLDTLTVTVDLSEDQFITLEPYFSDGVTWHGSPFISTSDQKPTSSIQEGAIYNQTKYVLDAGSVIELPFSTDNDSIRVTAKLRYCNDSGQWLTYYSNGAEISTSTESFITQSGAKMGCLHLTLPEDIKSGNFLVEIWSKHSDDNWVSARALIYIHGKGPGGYGATTLDEAKSMVDLAQAGTVGNVNKGRIRHIPQNSTVPGYWKNSEYDFIVGEPYITATGTTKYNRASNMCTRAAFSMCLSYLGIDKTPVAMSSLVGESNLNQPYYEVFRDQRLGMVLHYTGGYTSSGNSLAALYENYRTNSNYSPVFLWMEKHNNGNPHGFTVIGWDGEDIYYIADPTNRDGQGNVSWIKVKDNKIVDAAASTYRNVTITTVYQYYF